MTHDPKVMSLNLVWAVCCVLEQGTLLELAPLDPGVQMGTGLGWEGNRLVVQRTGDPLKATVVWPSH